MITTNLTFAEWASVFTDAMRLIDKKGIDAVLADMRERGVKV